MKYNAPYGVSDPEAVYINGNPATGTMGSIPPAASIEYPQREIVNLIAAVNIASPSNADLVQLAKAIQSSRLNFSTDFGTANAYVAHLAPAPDDYFTGMVCRLKVGNTNAGDSTLALYPLSPMHVVEPDGTNLQQYDLLKGQVATFVFDGAQWVLSGINSAGLGGPIFLSAPLDYYVNGATGNDAFNGSQAAVGAAPKGPFKTLQRASDAVSKFNLNGFNVTVHVADYVSYAAVRFPQVAGQGVVLWQGNSATPANCQIACGSATIDQYCLGTQGQNNQVDGFRLVGNLGTYGNGIAVGTGGQLIVRNIDYGPCNGCHNRVVSGGVLRFDGSASTGTFRISGGAAGSGYDPGCFVSCETAGHVDTVNMSSPPLMNITVPVTYGTAFIEAVDVGVTDLVFSGGFGAAGVTGKRYNAQTNGVVNSGGQGANYYPGTIAGTVSSGGQYI